MKTLEVPETLATKLFEISERSRKRPYDVIAELLLDRMEEAERLSTLLDLSVEFEKLGDELHSKGDAVEAGEAYWRALSYAMRAVAMKIGFDVTTYQDHFSLVEYLSYKLNNGSLVVSFLNAERLHGEFHPRPQNPEEFEFRKKHAKLLLTELRHLINEMQK
ncbi:MULTISPECIES: PaREP1 family protein [Metallosphaera]|uniref:PaREP1/PaREP8 domain containing family protein n=3 Tax=Metallosphaera TaxID=41980 RepID=A4YE49_METS5|nr:MULTISPECIES: PaREP1 family protein [Metallosphaera]ABP94701.1 PaREP1/PaREP8 domain containing family protein [Metallosphaera sedula DSM 5348]AIM26688.1 PaREP1/PaREP8 domain containing family protein [Metallosphaera sedula]AKV75257.1 hypothetical protein MsedA_0538 [Metallosphaera sedula]AKV77497.1 hypothetical protein MsedB_0538 [Metallosphaera sedula]AKV79744.1 hypothetical protein MsedC_0537 [Metallosphaera sedula]